MNSGPVATKHFIVDPENPDEAPLREAAELLSQGELVAFPTETVYGIAASVNHPEAVHRLEALQGRAKADPFSLHIASKDDLPSVVSSVPPLAGSLIEIYWPGPLTIIFPGSAGSGIGVRVPSHRVASRLIELHGAPLVAPSANRAGEPPACRGTSVLELFNGEIAAVLDAGETPLREPSTVVRIRDHEFEVLREGIISEAMIKRALKSRVIVLVCTGNSCRSPMAECLLKEKLAERLGTTVADLPKHGIRVTSAGVHAFSGGRASAHAIQLMRERGLDLESHRTKTLTRELAGEADLIITLSQGHRSQILDWDPTLEDKIFVINQEGVSDPIGGSVEVYRQCAEEIEAALRDNWIDRIMDE